MHASSQLILILRARAEILHLEIARVSKNVCNCECVCTILVISSKEHFDHSFASRRMRDTLRSQELHDRRPELRLADATRRM